MESNNITMMHLADETLLQILSYDILHRQDQYHLALVSRRFSTLVAVILYNTIEYLSYRSWRNPQIALLSRTCHEHPERAALVRHLSLSWIHDDEEGRFQIMDLLTQVPMLRSLVLIVQGDQELEESPDHPSRDCPNPTHFFDRCPMVFLRSLKVHCPRTTSNEVIKYTHLQSLEFLEIKYFDILQPFESSSNITESGDTISALKHLKFTYSIIPTRPVVETLVGHLNSLQSLDWEIYNVIDVIEWDSALSSHLMSLSKTLVKLRLVQHAFYQGFANDSEIDFTAYTALKDLSIDSCFVFSSKPARDIRQGGGKPLHYRLPSLLESLEITYSSHDTLTLVLGGDGEITTKTKGGYEWIIQLATHLAALSRLKIYLNSSYVQENIRYLGYNRLREWEYPDSVRETFSSRNIHLKVLVPPSFHGRNRQPVDTSWMTRTAVQRTSTPRRFRPI